MVRRTMAFRYCILNFHLVVETPIVERPALDNRIRETRDESLAINLFIGRCALEN